MNLLTSPWASPVVLVKKKDGSVRFCIDYRKLNSLTAKDAYPLPRIDDNLDALRGARWFSTTGSRQRLLAGRNGSRRSRKNSILYQNMDLHQFRVMPFGLCNAPGTFERLMETVLKGMQWHQSCYSTLMTSSSSLTVSRGTHRAARRDIP